MSIKTIRNQIVTQLKAYSDLTTFIGGDGADNISYGMPDVVDFEGANTKLVKVIQIEEDEDWGTMGATRVNAEYDIHVVGVFFETSFAQAEDDGADFSRHIKNALTSDYTLGGTVYTLKIKRSFFRKHPDKHIHYVIIPITCYSQVTIEGR